MTTRNPVCPYCKEKMVRAHVETEDGWRVCWLCGCRPDPEIIARASELKRLEEEHYGHEGNANEEG